MTDYPTIDPAAVHGGDVVRGTIQPFSRSEPFIVEGPVWIEHGEPLLGGWYLGEFTDLRLVSMGRCCTPPEPLCPFSMGETVYVKGAPKPLTVAGWNYYPAWGKWMVRCEDGTQGGDGELAYSLHPPLELTSSPPEPPLRVGDFVKGTRAHFEGQIVHVTDLADHSPYCVGGYWYESDELRRIEPPVGWPVGVPTEDGGTRWYVKHQENSIFYHRATGGHGISWADLLAAGGVPALAVSR